MPFVELELLGQNPVVVDVREGHRGYSQPVVEVDILVVYWHLNEGDAREGTGQLVEDRGDLLAGLRAAGEAAGGGGGANEIVLEQGVRLKTMKYTKKHMRVTGQKQTQTLTLHQVANMVRQV